MPDAIVSNVWAENMHFLRDRYVYDPIHFEFVRSVVALGLQSAPPAVDDDEVVTEADLDGAPPLTMAQLQARSAGNLHYIVLGSAAFLAETLAHAKESRACPRSTRCC